MPLPSMQPGAEGSLHLLSRKLQSDRSLFRGSCVFYSESSLPQVPTEMQCELQGLGQKGQA